MMNNLKQIIVFILLAFGTYASAQKPIESVTYYTDHGQDTKVLCIVYLSKQGNKSFETISFKDKKAFKARRKELRAMVISSQTAYKYRNNKK